jgi:hypothetical protein
VVVVVGVEDDVGRKFVCSCAASRRRRLFCRSAYAVGAREDALARLRLVLTRLDSTSRYTKLIGVNGAYSVVTFFFSCRRNWADAAHVVMARYVEELGRWTSRKLDSVWRVSSTMPVNLPCAGFSAQWRIQAQGDGVVLMELGCGKTPSELQSSSDG